MTGRQRPYRPDEGVIGQTLADAGAVHQRSDPDPAEVIRRTDTGHLKQLWRAESAGAQDDLLVGEGLVRASVTAVLDSDRTTVADDYVVDAGFGDDGRIVLVPEVAARRTPALALVDVDRRDRRTVEVEPLTSSLAATPAARAEATNRWDNSSGHGERMMCIGPCSIRANTGATSSQPQPGSRQPS
jgi:hypothetical protein